MTLVTNPQILFSSFLDGLRKVTDEFETCIDFVNESACPLTIKLNSETYISKVRELILSVASLTLENGEENKNSSVYLNSNGGNDERGQLNIILEKTKTGAQLEEADKSIRTVKTKTSKGFSIFYECLICQWKTSYYWNARRHVLNKHLKLGFPCTNNCKYFYFNERALQLHLPKCNGAKKVEQTKVQAQEIDLKWSKQKRPKIKINLHPHEKNSAKETAPEKMKSKSDLKKLTVRNPLKGFDLEKSMNVKIWINRVQRQRQQRKPENFKPTSSSTPVANLKGIQSQIKNPNQRSNEDENEQDKEREFSLVKGATNSGNSNNSKMLDIARIRSELVLKLGKRVKKN